jgi:hypothetical protein
MPSTGGVKLGSSYDEARTRKVNAEAEIAELELKKIHNELVNADDVVQAWTDVLGSVKSRLLSIPTKAAPVVAAETNAGMCQKIVEELIQEALEELSRYDPTTGPTQSTASQTEESDGGVEATAKPKRKRVGRPRKTSGLSK